MGWSICSPSLSFHPQALPLNQSLLIYPLWSQSVSISLPLPLTNTYTTDRQTDTPPPPFLSSVFDYLVTQPFSQFLNVTLKMLQTAVPLLALQLCIKDSMHHLHSCQSSVCTKINMSLAHMNLYPCLCVQVRRKTELNLSPVRCSETTWQVSARTRTHTKACTQMCWEVERLNKVVLLQHIQEECERLGETLNDLLGREKSGPSDILSLTFLIFLRLS